MAKCSGLKGDGTRCERIVGASAEFCYAHDPTRADERSRIASKAATAKGSVPIRNITRKLEKLADGVLTGTVDKATGSVVAQILGVLVRALEQERKQREQDEVLQRVQALEREQPSRRTTGGYPWQA